MLDIASIKLIAPTTQMGSQINEVTTATTEQTEDAELNRIADEREGGKRIKVSLNDL